jgi:hypothetical protein
MTEGPGRSIEDSIADSTPASDDPAPQQSLSSKYYRRAFCFAAGTFAVGTIGASGVNHGGETYGTTARVVATLLCGAIAVYYAAKGYKANKPTKITK